MDIADIPLGKPTIYPRQYAPHVLYAMPRSSARAGLSLPRDLPFTGEDIWNAWELSWLDGTGRPVVATAELRIPADSPNIIESKSLKLYLHSHALTRYASTEDLRDTLIADLGHVLGASPAVLLTMPAAWPGSGIGDLPGTCIDAAGRSFAAQVVDPGLLRIADPGEVSEDLHSHLLRSRCPVTRQPDTGSILVHYRGPRIDHGALLEYLVSYREHDAFHDACVEKIFVDLKERCAPEELTVYARYNRRGGLDINPWRTDCEKTAENIRLWRQ